MTLQVSIVEISFFGFFGIVWPDKRSTRKKQQSTSRTVAEGEVIPASYSFLFKLIVDVFEKDII